MYVRIVVRSRTTAMHPVQLTASRTSQAERANSATNQLENSSIKT
jgi:hypothetical protein